MMAWRTLRDLTSLRGAAVVVAALMLGTFGGPIAINILLTAFREAYPSEPFVQPLDWTLWVDPTNGSQRVNLVYSLPAALPALKVVGKIYNADTNGFVCQGVAYLPSERPGRFAITGRRLDRWLQAIDGETACLDKFEVGTAYVLEPLFCETSCAVGRTYDDRARSFVHAAQSPPT